MGIEKGVDLTARLLIVLALLVAVRVFQVYKSPVFKSSPSSQMLYPRRANDRVRRLVASRNHLLITGPPQAGKTTVVKQALGTSMGSYKDKVLLTPCFIDLRSLIKGESGGSRGDTASASPSSSSTVLPVPDALVNSVFASEASEFELRLIQNVHGNVFHWLTAFLTKHWMHLLSLGAFEDASGFSTISVANRESVSDILQHIVDSAEKYNRMLFAGEEMSVLPVIVIDEIQLLSNSSLKKLREELLSFLWKHMPAKQAAKAVVVLLSSESNTHSIISQWSQGESSMESLLFSEIIGDLDVVETKEFLLMLAHAANEEAKAKDEHEKGASSDENQLVQVAIPKPQRGGQSQAGASSASSQIDQSRLSARVENSTEFETIFKTYGGFIPDLIRLARAQTENPDDNVVITDRSKLQSLAAKLDTKLKQYKLDSKHVSTVFRAIAFHGTSPRGAVTFSELVDRLGVPEATIYQMAKLQLVEVRSANPELLDYAELKAFKGEVYVCAISPLARESMANVVKRLDKRGLKSPAPKQQAPQNNNNNNAGASPGSHKGKPKPGGGARQEL